VKERIDKIDSKDERKGEKKIQLLCAAEADRRKTITAKTSHRVYGPASIFSTVSSLVFRFHPFMVATRLTNPTT
jgi:hypothetical protein